VAFERRCDGEGIGRVAGRKRSGRAIRPLPLRRKLHSQDEAFAHNQCLNQVHAGVRHLGLIADAADGVHGDGRRQQRWKRAKDRSRLEEVLREVAVDHGVVYALVGRMDRQRCHTANSCPECVLL
jgi:hypothetical protein